MSDDESTQTDPLRPGVLVTGATGFLGSRLVAHLVGRGIAVTCTTRSTAPLAEDSVRWRQCDLTKPTAVTDLFAETRPALVFHLASHVSGLREPENVPLTLAGNLTAAVNVLLGALHVGSQRVVLAGSYEEPEPGAAPRSPYAAAKAGATAYARMFSSLYGLSTVVLRPAMIYGPGQPDTSKLIPYVARCFLAGEIPVLGSGRRPIDWVYVDDVVAAFAMAATTPGVDGEVIDIGSGELHTIAEVVSVLRALTGATEDAEFGGLGERSSEQILAADTARAEQLLGWRSTTSLQEGLTRTVESIRSETEAAARSR
jgi:nucleoside-diphosphate-sugar epimerase